jgi:mono/diheme cytochrome c family protein
MKKATIFAILLGLSAATAFAGPGANTDAGKETFGKKCVICHGKTGAGDGPAAKAFKGIPDLGSKEVQALSDADIAKVITEGKGKMQPVKDLSKGDVANLTAFIRTLKK